MYLNSFARGSEPLDLTSTAEFASLLTSAAELGIAYREPVRYRSRNLIANGQRFHVLEWGEDGAPLMLLLHGANQTSHSWDLVSLNLAQHYHIYAVDQRGHGDSEWPRDSDMSARAMVEDAAALLDGLAPGGGADVIMAHSMGGNVALRLLSERQLARRLVVVDTGPETGDAGRRMIQGFVQSAQEWDSEDHYVASVSQYDTLRSPEHIRRTMRYNIMQRADGKLVTKHFPRAQRVAAADPAANSRVTYEDVARIACPVLITRGEQSNVLLPDGAERFVAVLPDGKLVTVPACGHNVHSQNTPGFLAEVRPFLGLPA